MLKAIVNSPVRSGDQTIINGNIVIGTAGKGIDFSADPSDPGMTSELLADYEEGTFTPTLTSISNLPDLAVGSKAIYTKVGNVVTINLHLGSTSVGAAAEFTFSLPFAIKTNNQGLPVFGFGFPYALDWRGSAITITTVRTFATGTSAAAQDINIAFSYQAA
jgi:hypothetical protein